MLTVVIGTEAKQRIGQQVLEYSIRKSASREVEIRAVEQSQAPLAGTRFGFVRFQVPALCGFRGRAVYLDADQLVLADIHELAAQLEPPHAVGLVRDIEGTFDGKPVQPRNETSVMVLDCDKLRSWDPDTLFTGVVPNRETPGPGQIRYRDFMRLQWLDPSLIQAIDPRWNHYNIVREDTKLVHFSHVKSQPWKRPRHPEARFWEGWLVDAIAAGAVSRGDLLKAIARGHVHPHYLRQVVG
ncbi:MAG: glycosyltransferase [Myxococcota bacterium]